MILVNLRAGNIVTGYDRIRHIDQTLPQQWHKRLLATYERRREIYNQRMAAPKRNFWRGLGIALLILFIGVVLWFLVDDELVSWVAFGLGSLGLIGVWLALLYGVLQIGRSPTKPPINPFRTPLLAPLLPRWREELRGKFPPPDPADYGADAEKKFIEYISDLDASFVLYRLQQRSHEDADVIVVGRKGIWIFEIKFWQGTVTFRDGKWDRDDRIRRNENGTREKIQRPVTQPPDELWRRECGEIAITLQRRAREAWNRIPALAEINGGLAFTHPRAKLNIASTLSVEWGDAAKWKRKLANAPIVPEMDERTILLVIEALLARYQELTNMSAMVSMDRIAKQLEQQAETNLKNWINQATG